MYIKGHLAQKLLYRHTDQTNCFTWTTKVVDKNPRQADTPSATTTLWTTVFWQQTGARLLMYIRAATGTNKYS